MRFIAIVSLVLLLIGAPVDQSQTDAEYPRAYAYSGDGLAGDPTVEFGNVAISNLNASNAAHLLSNITWPIASGFNVTLNFTIDETPVHGMARKVVDGVVVREQILDLIAVDENGRIISRVGVDSNGLGGYIDVRGHEADLDGAWVGSRLDIQVTGVDGATMAHARSSAPQSDDGTDPGGVGPNCDAFLYIGMDDPFCADLLLYGNAIPLGESQDSTQFHYQRNPPAGTLKMMVFHEGKLSLSKSNCALANDRIFEEETEWALTCDYFNVGSTFDNGGNNGHPDWIDFRQKYYQAVPETVYFTEAKDYNNGRFVMFQADEWRLGTSSSPMAIGWAVGCDPGWTSHGAPTACGHMASYDRIGGKYGHSEGKVNGMTYAHELLHTLHVEAASSGSKSDNHGHDYLQVVKDYTDGNGCDPFTSRSVYYPTITGGNCIHQHYWVSPDVENQVNANAPGEQQLQDA